MLLIVSTAETLAVFEKFFMLSHSTHNSCSSRPLLLVSPIRDRAQRLMTYFRINHMGHQKPKKQAIPVYLLSPSSQDLFCKEPSYEQTGGDEDWPEAF